jgi:hypothetical protein
MAAFMGRDVSKLKAKGGGKFKYMSEKDMLEIAAPFSPYRYVCHLMCQRGAADSKPGVSSCGICGDGRMSTSALCRIDGLVGLG